MSVFILPALESYRSYGDRCCLYLYLKLRFVGLNLPTTEMFSECGIFINQRDICRQENIFKETFNSSLQGHLSKF